MMANFATMPRMKPRAVVSSAWRWVMGLDWHLAKQNWRTIFAVTWALLALYLLWGWSQNGRYETAPYGSMGHVVVIDTRTGLLYRAADRRTWAKQRPSTTAMTTAPRCGRDGMQSLQV